jgi:hypothetical protein
VAAAELGERVRPPRPSETDQRHRRADRELDARENFEQPEKKTAADKYPSVELGVRTRPGMRISVNREYQTQGKISVLLSVCIISHFHYFWTSYLAVNISLEGFRSILLAIFFYIILLKLN